MNGTILTGYASSDYVMPNSISSDNVSPENNKLASTADKKNTIAGIVAQDQLSSLYTNHHTWLRGWLNNKLSCSAQSDDLTQDTFFRLIQLQNKAGPLPDIKQPRAYLATVARRLLYDYFSRLSLERAYLEALANLPETVQPSPQAQLIFQQTLVEIDQLLDNMKPMVRTTFLLSQLEGLNYLQISVKLNISTRTVKRYMAKAFEECMIIMMESE